MNAAEASVRGADHQAPRQATAGRDALFSVPFVLAAPLVLIQCTASATLYANLRAQVYPTHADSIAIPWFETLQLCKIAAVLLAGVIALSWLRRRRAVRAAGILRWACAIAAGLAYLCSAAFFVLWGLSWWGPDHYAIAVSCLLALGPLAIVLADEWGASSSPALAQR